MNSDAFKDRLRLVMAGASNRSFAEKCAVSDGTLRSYLKGDTFPPLDTLQVIARVSECSVAWLASGEGKMREDVTYPLGEELKTADIINEQAHDQSKAPIKPDLSWFYEWINEELRGKTMSEIMAIAVKMKNVIDENKGGMR